MTCAAIIPFRRPAPTFEPARPFINDVCFDDLWHMRPDLAADLTNRGVVYCTETRGHGGTIIARDWDHAEQLAAARGLGERVIGQLVERH